MQTAPLCPSWGTVQQRRGDGSAPFSVLQRARMADIVSHLLENSQAVHVSITLSPPRVNGTVPAADNGNSEFNYINETWAARMGIEWTTQDVAKVFVDQVAGSEIPCSIVGSLCTSQLMSADFTAFLRFSAKHECASRETDPRSPVRDYLECESQSCQEPDGDTDPTQ
jgi:hypothetical protein